jgi:hypothetical protein
MEKALVPAGMVSISPKPETNVLLTFHSLIRFVGEHQRF